MYVFLCCTLAVSQFPCCLVQQSRLFLALHACSQSVPVLSRAAEPPHTHGSTFMNHSCMRSAPRNSPRSERQPIPVLPNAADQAFVYSLSFLLLPDPAFFIYSDCLHAFLPSLSFPPSSRVIALPSWPGQQSHITFTDACMQVEPQVGSA